MDKMTRNKYIVFLGGILLISLIGYFRSTQLTSLFMDNHIFGKGLVTGVKYGGKTPGGIYYEIKGVQTKYRLKDSKSSSCRKIVRQKLNKLKGIHFPVAYLEERPSLSEILLFKSDYEKFNIPIPEHLKEIVEELSVCED